MQVRHVLTTARAVTLAVLAAVLVTLLGTAPSAAASGKCGGTPFAVAETDWDDNIIGKYTYFMRVKSELYRCGGYVRAVHTAFLDGSRLPLGTTVRIFVGTRRSDGKWHGQTATMASSQNVSARRYEQMRGVGGGLPVTHVRLGHFAEPGQTLISPPSSRTSDYERWNGPEAAPYRG